MMIVLYALTTFLYGALAVRSWLPASAVASVRAERWPQGLWLAAAVCHGLLLHQTSFSDGRLVFGFAQALSVMAWLGVCLYWLENLFVPLRGLDRLVLPAALVGLLLPLGFAGTVVPVATSPLFKLHFLIANAAYGLLALAALHAVLMLFVERQLHGGARMPGWATGMLGWFDTLPPLMTLERLLFRLIGAGFLMLTLTLASGFLFSEQLFGRALRLDHKTVFASLSWLMFAALLIGRVVRGWRGRIALRWALASFALLLLAYVGSRFVIEVLLQRTL